MADMHSTAELDLAQRQRQQPDAVHAYRNRSRGRRALFRIYRSGLRGSWNYPVGWLAVTHILRWEEWWLLFPESNACQRCAQELWQ
jgi:hypothetical protein